MRERSLSMVATIATSLTIACSDAAVKSPTAPPIAATPASAVANDFPTMTEIFASGAIAGALGIQITVSPHFEADYKTFVVPATIRFQAANEVSGVVTGWLINQFGTKINEGSSGFAYTRFGLPVAQGDTAVTVRISTNNITCGLIGKSSYRGSAFVKAANLITVWSQTIETTHGPDVVQPGCPPPPPPPPDECGGPATRVVAGATAFLGSVVTNCEEIPVAPTGGGGPVEVCYIVWRELWIYDYTTRRYTLVASWPIGVQCYQS